MSKLIELYDMSAHTEPIINPLKDNFVFNSKITIEEWNKIFGDYATITEQNKIMGNYRLYEKFMMREYGDLKLNSFFERLYEYGKEMQPIDLQNSIQALSCEFLIANIDKYKRLFEIEMVEFNPIENYDRYEDEEIKDGNRTDVNNFGEVVVNNSSQPFSVTSNNGERNNVTQNGEVTKSTKDSVVGYNSEIAKNRNLVDETTNANSVTNTLSAFTDTVQTGEQVNTNRTNQHNDEFNKGEQINNRTSHIHGNIGVTTAPQMLTEYKKFYSEHRNIIITMLNDFIEYVTMGIYE